MGERRSSLVSVQPGGIMAWEARRRSRKEGGSTVGEEEVARDKLTCPPAPCASSYSFLREKLIAPQYLTYTRPVEAMACFETR